MLNLDRETFDARFRQNKKTLSNRKSKKDNQPSKSQRIISLFENALNQLTKQPLFQSKNSNESGNANETGNISESETLMKRIDTKYLVPQELLPFIVSQLKDDYSVVVDNQITMFSYQTTYFDTEDQLFYLQHHNGKANRKKVRHRFYMDSGSAFMEVKTKDAKGQTLKARKPTHPTDLDCFHFSEFIESQSSINPMTLNKNLEVFYKRVTLFSKSRLERVTIDFNICFKSHINGEKSALSNTAIIEVKRPINQTNSDAIKLFNKQSIKPLNFSKYCIGTILTESTALKQNRFKPTLDAIHKIETPLKTENFRR